MDGWLDKGACPPRIESVLPSNESLRRDERSTSKALHRVRDQTTQCDSIYTEFQEGETVPGRWWLGVGDRLL